MKKLQLPNTVIFRTTKEEENFIKKMTSDIHKCPVRNSCNRTLSTIHEHVYSGVILEFALQRLGWYKNSLAFDKTIPNTYNWDVEKDGIRAEVKSTKPPFVGPAKTKFKSQAWQGIRARDFKKILKHKDSLDVVIFGYHIKSPETDLIECRWTLIAPVDDTFKFAVKQKKYRAKGDAEELFYNHNAFVYCDSIFG